MPLSQILLMCHLLVAEQCCRICELRNGWYTENYTESVPAALANNAFYGSAENGKISSALRAELAEAAADYAVALVQVGLGEGFAGLIAQWDMDTSNGALTCCLKRAWYLVIKICTLVGYLIQLLGCRSFLACLLFYHLINV